MPPPCPKRPPQAASPQRRLRRSADSIGSPSKSSAGLRISCVSSLMNGASLLMPHHADWALAPAQAWALGCTNARAPGRKGARGHKAKQRRPRSTSSYESLRRSAQKPCAHGGLSLCFPLPCGASLRPHQPLTACTPRCVVADREVGAPGERGVERAKAATSAERGRSVRCAATECRRARRAEGSSVRRR